MQLATACVNCAAKILNLRAPCVPALHASILNAMMRRVLPGRLVRIQALNMQDSSTRRSAHQIFEEVTHNAREELSRGTVPLLFSGLAGGISMGLTGLGVALAISYLGDSPTAQFIAFAFYPIGFIVVIIGRAQLFTENTLYPVVLILDEHKHVLNTLRLWGA